MNNRATNILAVAVLAFLLGQGFARADVSTSGTSLNSFRAPSIFFQDAGVGYHYPVYVAKGADMSSGSQLVAICFGGQPTPDGLNCGSPEGRAGYFGVATDGYMVISAYLRNDAVGALSWNGIISNNDTISSSSTGAAFSATSSGYFKLAGVATGSLPPCDATRKGGIHFDTTTNKHVGCDGSTWNNLY